jgi:hypothetical protein
VSSDHRRRPIDKRSISRSRERPPDQKRGRRPAGTAAAHLENTGKDNSNTPVNSLITFQEQGERRGAFGGAPQHKGRPTFMRPPRRVTQVDKEFDACPWRSLGEVLDVVIADLRSQLDRGWR